MSFRDAILKKKKDLSATETKLTQFDGSVIIETRSKGGFAKVASADVKGVSHGYVIDLKPDLQVAEIFPWLSFGSQDVACDETLLQQFCITDVLSLGVTVPHFDGITYKYMEVLDVPEFNFLSLFHQCFHILDSVHSMKRTMFVHCNAGISRSSTVVAAYYMRHTRCSLEEALKVIKRARPCAKPNKGFMEQLRMYERRLFPSDEIETVGTWSEERRDPSV